MIPSESGDRVRTAVYDSFVKIGRAPALADLADASGLSLDGTRQTLQALADAHVLVLQPGGDAIWMAMPFSNLPTAFRVTAADPAGTAGSWWANCAWDALGIAALLAGAGHAVARGGIDVVTSCPDCREPLVLTVHDVSSPAGPTLRFAPPHDGHEAEGVVHFALPAADWWTDIGFT